MVKLKFKNKNGFTLIELLLTLSLLSLITFMSVPIVYKVYEYQQTKHFFRVFDADVLFIQNQALHESNDYEIILERNAYSVLDRKGTLFVREYPKHITYRNSSQNKINFYRLGTVKDPGTFSFYANNGTRYKVVFPLGKGRHYIERK